MKNSFNLFLLSAAFLLLHIGCEDASESPMQQGPNAGKGGSMAQFTIYGGQLYLLEGDKLHTYSLENPAAPQRSNSVVVGQDAETLFPYAGNLYIGTQSGMLIYSLENPQNPRQLSAYQHITSCDPVVVEGNYAYLTLRTGSPCRWGVNELQILDIRQPANPQLLFQMVMENPQGLAVNEGTLFVCNGEAGLMVLNVSNPYDPRLIREYPDFAGYDVIFTSRSLMMVGADGLVQYDPTDPANLRQLSVLPVHPAL